MARVLEASRTLKPKTRSEPVGSASAWVLAGISALAHLVGEAPTALALCHPFLFSPRVQPAQSKPRKVGNKAWAIWAAVGWDWTPSCPALSAQLPRCPHPYLGVGGKSWNPGECGELGVG